jgi:hypothetical protein
LLVSRIDSRTFDDKPRDDDKLNVVVESASTKR